MADSIGIFVLGVLTGAGITIIGAAMFVAWMERGVGPRF